MNQNYNNTGLYVYLCSYIYQCSLFLPMGISYWLLPFHFILKGSLFHFL